MCVLVCKKVQSGPGYSPKSQKKLTITSLPLRNC